MADKFESRVNYKHIIVAQNELFVLCVLKIKNWKKGET